MAPWRTTWAASEAVSFAWPSRSWTAPAALLITPSTWFLVSPVTRPKPSCALPPRFLAVPTTRSSFIGVTSLCVVLSVSHQPRDQEIDFPDIGRHRAGMSELTEHHELPWIGVMKTARKD